MLTRTVLMALAAVIAAGAAYGQNADTPKSAEPAKFYKLDFSVKEVEGGKMLNARQYSMIVAGELREPASMRAGTRVPVPTVAGSNTQFSYVEVGASIDCRMLKEVQRDLSLSVSADISSLPSESAPPAPAGMTGAVLPPAVRQNRWSSSVTVPLKRPTVIFSSDDPASRRQMQLELTATPIGQ